MRNSVVGSVVSLALVACSSSPSAPAQLEQASDLQLSRVMSSALSMDSLMLSFAAASYAGLPDSQTSCPKITTDGNRRHVVGGCTTEDGRIEGELILENVPALFDDTSDPTRPMVIEADDFAVGSGPGQIRFDGTVSRDPAGVSQVSLDAELFGITVHTEAAMACPNGVCTYQSGSLDVDGVGSATVEGTFSFTTNTVDLHVIGEDTLAISSEGNCLIWAVGGRSARQCNQGGSSGSPLDLLEQLRSADHAAQQR